MEKDQAYRELGYEPNLVNELTATCPACDEAQDRCRADGEKHSICHYCPIRGHWPNINGEFNKTYCTGPRLAYSAWSDMTREQHSLKTTIKVYAGYILQSIKYWK